MFWNKMAAFYVVAVATLLCQSSAQYITAPNVGIPWLQPLLSQPVYQTLDQVPLVPSKASLPSLIPINNCVSASANPVSTAVVERPAVDSQIQVSSILRNLIPAINSLSVAKPAVSTSVVESTQPLQQLSSVLPKLRQRNSYLPLSSSPVVSTVPESSKVGCSLPLQQVQQISSISPFLSNLAPINNYLTLSNAPITTAVVENPVVSQYLSQVSQIPQISPVLSNIPCNPYANPPLVIPNTIVDNSLANTLANTLQLLLANEIIESSRSPQTLSLSSLLALYDAIGTIGTTASPLDVISSSVDVTSSGSGTSVEVSTVVSDVVSAPIIPVVQSPIVSNLVETVPAYPQVYAPVTEVYAPAPISSSVTNVYGSVVEGPVVTEVSSSVDVNTVSVTPVAPINPYFVQPSLSEVTVEVTEVVSSSPVSYAPSYYSRYPDFPSWPYPTEIVLPQSIPAQIVCNVEYSPVNMPYLSMYVEPLSPINGYYC